MSDEKPADARAQYFEQLGRSLVALDENEGTRGRFRELVAEAMPQYADQVPGYVAKREIAPVKEALQKELDEIKQQRQQEANAQRYTAFLTTMRDKGVPEGELKDAYKFAVDNAIGHPEYAAMGYLNAKAVAHPSPITYPSIEIPGARGAGGDFFKGIMEDRDGWRRKRATKDFADLAAGRPLDPLPA